MKLLSLVTVLLLLGSEAFAVCFSKREIRSFRAESRTEVLLRGRSNRIYEVTVNPCYELRFAERIAFRTWPSNSNRVCRGDQILVLDDFYDEVTERCSIRRIRLRN